ncbi:MAG: hypothetical protein QM831_45090 [Kofleriaceae bacterium]
MSFDWLERTQPQHGAHHRERAALAELADRAATLFRLGFTQHDATRRLAERVAWEYDPPSKSGPHHRIDALSDAAIAKVVADVYARRPH